MKKTVVKLISTLFPSAMVKVAYKFMTNPQVKKLREHELQILDIDDVARQVGINAEVKNRLIQRIEQETNLEVSQLNVSKFVQSIAVDSALIIHDKNDRVIPIQQSRNVSKNWQRCQLEEIEGTGHFRILRTPSVLNKVVAFMN